MADEEQSQEKTEQPSSKRLKESRKKGRLHVPKILMQRSFYYLPDLVSLFLGNNYHCKLPV